MVYRVAYMQTSNLRVAVSAGLSLFWVIFIWGFWGKGPYALGINTALYLGALLVFLVWILRSEGRYREHDLAWILPLGFMCLSFALYENPFFKMFSLVVFPAMLALFYNYAWIGDKEKKTWNYQFLAKMFERTASIISAIGESAKSFLGILTVRGGGKKETTIRVITGVLVLLVALFVILPLLSTADAAFADKLGGLYDFIREIFSTSIIGKVAMFLFLSVMTLSLVIAWAKPEELAEQPDERTRDPIIWGITLVGVLIFYAIFLWVQLDRLWVGELPFDFKETESLVKSGFWQLLVLSFLNLAVFFFLYRKTSAGVQKILGLFTIASLLLLVSSAHRMWLYVTYYGFSYEKFYASYVVLFCAILFVWLLSRMITAKRANIVKFVAFQFLWMYALVALFPVEQFILKANVVLKEKPNSQIRLFEMTMLSPDVLAQIKDYQRAGVLEESKDYLNRESGRNPDEQFDWNPWIEEQEKILAEKKWYETTVSGWLQ